MEIEVVDDDEFDLIEAACRQAEQNIDHSSHEVKSKRPRFLPSSLAPAPAAPPLPFLIYRGKTTYCRQVSEIDRAAAFLLAVGATVGFDVEWHVTYASGQTPRPIALIQLTVVDPSIYIPDRSTPYHCFLLHINRRRNKNEKDASSSATTPALSPRLLELLTSETVLKAGIGIHGDSLKLERDYGIQMKGLIDLSEVANTRLCSATIPPKRWSIAALAEKLMGKTVRKSQHIRCSDWEQDPLTIEQQTYAATDSWASLRLHEILCSMPITWQSNSAAGVLALAGTNMGSVVVAQSANENSIDTNVLVAAAADQECVIPACKEPAVLQPAKLAALIQHQQGVAVAEIAAQRQIQPSTVQSYLAEAIIAGYAYNWSRICVENEIILLAAEVASQVGIEVAAGSGSETEKDAALFEYQPGTDVLNEVLAARNIKIRALFEEMEPRIPGGVGFGDLRLAFAHLGRQSKFSSLPRNHK